MAIESVPVALVPTKAPAPMATTGTGKPTAKNQVADKAAKDFRNLLEGLEAAVDTPADAAVPDTPIAGDTSAGLEKPLDGAQPSVAGTTSADAATWMAAYLPPVPVPVPIRETNQKESPSG